MIKWFFNKVIHFFKVKFQKFQWRKINKHNFTKLGGYIDRLDLVKVGNFSYGDINIQFFENNTEGLIIGNFVSIANDVKFILGGNHQISTFTTYPLKSILIKKAPDIDAITKGKIIVEDEVWIGNGAIILSGVKIGRGAIIAAGSVITKDIEPYSIVGGNPAKLMRYRFSREIIIEREKININDFSKEDLIKNIDLFYNELSLESLKRIENINK